MDEYVDKSDFDHILLIHVEYICRHLHGLLFAAGQ